MTIEAARRYIEDHAAQIQQDYGRRIPNVFTLCLAAKWGDDREVIAAVEKYLHFKLFDGEVIEDDLPLSDEMATTERETR